MTKLFYRCALLASAALTTLFLSSCTKPQTKRMDFAMGENVPVGSMTYAVIETVWKTQLGEGFQARTPEHRFLLVKISVSNATGKDVSLPMLTIEGRDGKTNRELANGDGVDNWFGVLRTLSNGQTQQGTIVFDVPLSSYKLRVPDIADSGFDGYAVIQIPLQINPDLPLESPIDPDGIK
jgi:Domain of unknown function (DUF4352)